MTSQESTRETRLEITVVTITTREAGYYSPNREWLRREMLADGAEETKIL